MSEDETELKTRCWSCDLLCAKKEKCAACHSMLCGKKRHGEGHDECQSSIGAAQRACLNFIRDASQYHGKHQARPSPIGGEHWTEEELNFISKWDYGGML